PLAFFFKVGGKDSFNLFSYVRNVIAHARYIMGKVS
ncbi:MAG: hypothetical protein ACI9NN_001438, partial [Bacteroidia bacterium]